MSWAIEFDEDAVEPQRDPLAATKLTGQQPSVQGIHHPLSVQLKWQRN